MKCYIVMTNKDLFFKFFYFIIGNKDKLFNVDNIYIFIIKFKIELIELYNIFFIYLFIFRFSFLYYYVISIIYYLYNY